MTNTRPWGKKKTRKYKMENSKEHSANRTAQSEIEETRSFAKAQEDKRVEALNDEPPHVIERSEAVARHSRSKPGDSSLHSEQAPQSQKNNGSFIFCPIREQQISYDVCIVRNQRTPGDCHFADCQNFRGKAA
jgi:hypothetical protein